MGGGGAGGAQGDDVEAAKGGGDGAGGGTLPLRIFIDRSSMEVFANDGKGVMTNLVFPTVPYNKLTISAEDGSAKIKNLKIYTIKAAN